MSEEGIKTDHFKTMGELLKHLKMWEIDDDYDAYYRFFCPRCAYEMAHKIDKLQKENFNYRVANKLLEDEAYKDGFEERKKLEKVIDLMATELSRRPLMIYLDDERDDRLAILDNPKEIIKYYTKKAEE